MQRALRTTALLLLTAALPATGANLFHPVAVPKDRRAPQMLQAPTAVAIDAAAIKAAGNGGILHAPLPNGLVARVRIDHIERHANGDISWQGKVLDAERGELRAIGTSGSTGTHAELDTAHGTWGLVPAESGGHDWLFDKTGSELALPAPHVDDTRLPPPDFGFGPKATCPAVTSKPSTQTTIDVMAVITPDFVSTHGGAAGAETRLNYIFTNMNAYNAASNIAITYRRVATLNVNYQASSTPGDEDDAALDSITHGRGVFGNVPALRNFFGADMVAMFRGPRGGGNSISGLAWLNGDRNGNIPASHASHMYSVSGDWRFSSVTLPAHELGHNLGMAHDRPNAGSGGGSTPYSYGHFVCGAGADSTCGQSGFNRTGTGFGTIMSYHQPTVGKFASPSLTCQGTQSGAIAAPCGAADQQDDVRATNCVRQTVAAFRSSWVGTCTNLSQDTDRDGIPDCIEGNSGKSATAKDNDVFANGLLFAAQQYRDFLSREGDADGLNYWTGAVNSGAASRTSMIEGFLTSAEFQGVIAPVARLYFAYFLRIPDYAGLDHWIRQYKAGTALEHISQQFAASAEFASRYGSLSNGQFVELVYNNVLARAPDSAGLRHWTSQLDSGTSRGAVMLAFSESAEYRALAANDVYVTMTYMGMLRRAPDSGGFAHWTGYLDAGNSGSALISGFLNSAEYRGRFLP